jgi:hypothetical protein
MDGLVGAGDHAHELGQSDAAQEEHAHQHSHDDQGAPGVLALGGLEGRDAVADSFNAGQRSATGGKGVQCQQRGQVGGSRGGHRNQRGGPVNPQAYQAVEQHRQVGEQEKINRDRHERTGLAQAAHVKDGDQGQHGQRGAHLVGQQHGKC